MANYSDSQPVLGSKSRRPRKLLVILFGFGVITVAILLVSIIFSSNHCLDVTDYKDLTGTTVPYPGAFVPKTDFYAYVLSFSGKSTTYAPDASAITSTIGKFYQSHRRKSIVITVDSIGAISTGETVAQARIQDTKTNLVRAGVKASAIKTDAPNLIDTEPGSKDIVTLSITTGESCR